MVEQLYESITLSSKSKEGLEELIEKTKINKNLHEKNVKVKYFITSSGDSILQAKQNYDLNNVIYEAVLTYDFDLIEAMVNNEEDYEPDYGPIVKS